MEATAWPLPDGPSAGSDPSDSNNSSVSLVGPHNYAPGPDGTREEGDKPERSKRSDTPQTGKKTTIHPGRPSKPDPTVALPECRWVGCKLSFATAQGARDHELSHSAFPELPENAYICRIGACSKQFSDSKTLRKHMMLHQPKSFECQECGKQFHEATKLRRHLVVHSGAKNFVCEECGKSFSFKANLKTHMRVHTGERPFSCTVEGCKRTFAQASNRNAHALTHFKDGVPLALDASSQSSSPASAMLSESPNTESTTTQTAESTTLQITNDGADKRRDDEDSAPRAVGNSSSVPNVPVQPPPSVAESGRRPSMPTHTFMFSSPLPKGAEELFMLSTPRLTPPDAFGLKRTFESEEDSNERRKRQIMSGHRSATVPQSSIGLSGMSAPGGTSVEITGQRAFQLYSGSGSLLPPNSAFRSSSPFFFGPAVTAPQQSLSQQGSPRLVIPNFQQTMFPAPPSMQSTPVVPVRSNSLGGLQSSQSGGSVNHIASAGSSGSGANDFDKSALFRLAQMSTDMLDRSLNQTPKGMSVTPPPFPSIPGPSSASGIFSFQGSGRNSSSSSDKSLLFSSSFTSLNSSNGGSWSPQDESRLIIPGLRLSPEAFNHQAL